MLCIRGRSVRTTTFFCRLVRFFSSPHENNPFQILGIPPNSSLDHAKRAFVKLALHHHPDRETGSVAEFLRVRDAFETIREQYFNSSETNSNTTNSWNGDYTDDLLSFAMDEATRQEVIQAFRTLQPSGRDRGGYWEMARILSERDALGGTDEPILRLENGSKSSTLGRRRRRRK